MKTIDALTLRNAFISGERRLDENKEIVNSLNVFPVPDGDTGINMSLTMKSAINQVKSVQDISVYNIAKAASDGALMGARGNSGVILSQLLRGFSNALKEVDEIGVAELKDAIVSSYKLAYKAVMKPTEGTILTVARCMGEFAQDNYMDYEKVDTFLKDIIKEGRIALENTPNLLPPLKEAGVVDSGGRGLLYVYEGALNSENIDKTEVDFGIIADAIVTSHKQMADEDIKFTYCTEFMIMVSDYDHIKFRDKIEKYGDSIIVVAGDDLIKTHIHTNHPGTIFEMALEIGPLKDIKVENMKLQHSHLIHTDKQVQEAKEKEKQQQNLKEYGFVAVSKGEGFDDIFKEGFGVDELIVGGQTMNPSTEDLLSKIEKVNAKTVFLFPNNKNIILAAQTAKEISKKNVIIIKTTSIPQAFSALIEFDPDLSAEENEKLMLDAIEKTKVCELTYAVRDTKMDGLDIKKDDIIGLVNGKLKSNGRNMIDVVLDVLSNAVDKDSSMITIYYGEDVTKEEANKIFKKLEEEYFDLDIDLQYGGQSLYYYIFSVE